MKFHILAIYSLFIFLVSYWLPFGSARPLANEKPLVLGVFPRFHPQIALDSFTPLTKYLSKKLNRRVRLEVSYNFSEFWQKLKNRKFDIVHYNQYHYIRSHKEQGYDVIAMNEEQGRSTMSAAIVVRKDSGIKSISDLRGKKILFGGSQQAMISYIYATYLLREGGLKPGDYQIRFEVNPPKAVVAAYHGLWDAAAAGTGDIALNQPVIKKQIDTSKLKYLTVGAQFGHIPWAVKSEMAPELKNRITDALVHIKSDPKGRKILKKAKISGIVPARDSDYNPHRRITKLIMNEKY